MAARHLLLAGPPGAGKRTVASVLEEENGFSLLEAGEALDMLLEKLGSLEGDAVTTWQGSLTAQSVPLADLLGVELVWLRAAAAPPLAGVRIVDAVDAFDEPRPAATVASEILSVR